MAKVGLKKGKKYIVHCVGGRDGIVTSYGIFEGYTAVGSEEAICLRLTEEHGEEAGLLRIILISSVMYIDCPEGGIEVEKEPQLTYLS
ncbi:MAG: hypothetical protein DRN14_02485 [Thermoplasmata archaeon]|nr:MAG: hypothetical protein DRN14_02485 [Thermoplasmata archaeon]HDJ27057.1 hypothetical protein [Aciduliprofundum sp.]